MCKNHNNTRHPKDHCRQFSQQQHQRRRTPFWSWTKYRWTQYFLLNAHLYLFFIRNFKTKVLESSITDNCSFYPAHPEKFYHPVTYEIMYQVYDKTCMGSQKCCLFFFFLHQFKMKIFQKGKRWFLRKIFSIKIWCRVKWSKEPI